LFRTLPSRLLSFYPKIPPFLSMPPPPPPASITSCSFNLFWSLLLVLDSLVSPTSGCVRKVLLVVFFFLRLVGLGALSVFSYTALPFDEVPRLHAAPHIVCLMQVVFPDPFWGRAPRGQGAFSPRVEWLLCLLLWCEIPRVF